MNIPPYKSGVKDSVNLSVQLSTDNGGPIFQGDRGPSGIISDESLSNPVKVPVLSPGLLTEISS